MAAGGLENFFVKKFSKNFQKTLHVYHGCEVCTGRSVWGKKLQLTRQRRLHSVKISKKALTTPGIGCILKLY